MTMLGIFFLTPFFMERGLQLSTTHVAILLTSQQFYNVLTSYLGGWLHDRTHARWIRPVGMGMICLGFFALSLTAPLLTFTTYMLVAIPIGLGMGTFMSVNNTVIMSAVPGHLRGFASGMLETTRQGGHMFAVPLVSSIMTAVAGATLTAQTDPALYIRGFQAACMVVGCIGLIVVAFAFVPEGGHAGKFRGAVPVGPADSPGAHPQAPPLALHWLLQHAASRAPCPLQTTCLRVLSAQSWKIPHTRSASCEVKRSPPGHEPILLVRLGALTAV
jgi:MFS family permease